MNNEQQQIIDEALKNYWSNAKYNNLDYLVKQEEGSFLVEIRCYYKEEFINKCKTNLEFSEKWGLRIEERELSLEERVDMFLDMHNGDDVFFNDDEHRIDVCDDYDVPTKLITLTYNNETIESYE